MVHGDAMSVSTIFAKINQEEVKNPQVALTHGGHGGVTSITTVIMTSKLTRAKVSVTVSVKTVIARVNAVTPMLALVIQIALAQV